MSNYSYSLWLGMWDWKELRYMRLLGWVSTDDEEKRGTKLKWRGFFCFWIIPVAVTSEYIGLVLNLINKNYSEAVTAIAETATGTTTMLKSFMWAYRGSEIKSIIKDIEDLDNRRKKYFFDDDHTDSIMDAHTETCSKYPNYFIVSLVAGIHYMIRPFASSIQGDYVLLVVDWVPWDDRSSFIGWFVHMLLLSATLSCCLPGMLAYETLTLSFNELTIGLVESISYGLTRLKFESGSAVRDKLRELQGMHQDALNITKKVNKFINYVIQTECVLFTLRMCCGILEISLDLTTTTKKINTVEMCLVCAIFFYLQCYKCQTVTEKFLNVGSSAYDNDWYKGTTENKLDLSIIIERSKKPVLFGSLIHIDLDTFIMVLKTSFSYYNALKAFDIH